MNDGDISIRQARVSDAPAIAQIYAPYVLDTNVTFDVVAPGASAWADRIEAAQNAGWPFLVVCDDADVVGFAYVGQWRPKAAYAHTVENSIYLGRTATGRGLGRQLLDELIARCRATGIHQMVAVIVDVGSDASERLHASCGFVAVGTLRGVGEKHGASLDTLLMQLDLTIDAP